MSDLLNSMSLDDWHGELTEFDGSFSTAPSAQLFNVPWPELCAQLAPSSGPIVVPDKRRATYFLPCMLGIAPLVGQTRAKALAQGRPLFGKQRSASHVTEASWVVLEFDGIECAQFESGIRGLKRAGIACIAYTTHSIGLKPGLRARVVLPVDTPLDTAGYKAAHAAINARFFDGTADKSGGRLCQQQGVWAAHPSRVHLARRWNFRGGVLAVSALGADARAASPQSVDGPSRHSPTTPSRETATTLSGPPPSIKQVQDAMQLFSPNDFHDWDRVVSLGVAMAGYGGKFAGDVQQSVEDFSNAAGLDAKAKNDKPQYDPGARFQNWKPTVPPNVAAATLFGEARDRARKIVEGAMREGRWAGTRPAWEYLSVHHRRVWDEIYSAAPEAAK